VDINLTKKTNQNYVQIFRYYITLFEHDKIGLNNTLAGCDFGLNKYFKMLTDGLNDFRTISKAILI